MVMRLVRAISDGENERHSLVFPCSFGWEIVGPCIRIHAAPTQISCTYSCSLCQIVHSHVALIGVRISISTEGRVLTTERVLDALILTTNSYECSSSEERLVVTIIRRIQVVMVFTVVRVTASVGLRMIYP